MLVYQSIGVVYGGLGTSPLYVYPNVFTSTPAPADVLGTMSLIFWTLTIVVIFKYVSLVLHANDKGEGMNVHPPWKVWSSSILDALDMSNRPDVLI